MCQLIIDGLHWGLKIVGADWISCARVICSAKLGPNRLNEVGRSKAVGRGWLYIFGAPLYCNDDLNPSGRCLTQSIGQTWAVIQSYNLSIHPPPSLAKECGSRSTRVAAILFLRFRRYCCRMKFLWRHWSDRMRNYTIITSSGLFPYRS